MAVIPSEAKDLLGGARDPSFALLTQDDLVQHEDMGICERVQRGLESWAYDKGRFSAQYEEGGYHFQVLLKQAYGAWLAAARASV